MASVTLINALILPPATTPMTADITARPVKAVAIQYTRNITLLAVCTAPIASLIALGHFKSFKLTDGFSSLCTIAVGSK